MKIRTLFLLTSLSLAAVANAQTVHYFETFSGTTADDVGNALDLNYADNGTSAYDSYYISSDNSTSPATPALVVDTKYGAAATTGIMSSAVSLGSNVGDTLKVTVRLRQITSLAGTFRFGVWNSNGTTYLTNKTDDFGYQADFAASGASSLKAWEASTGGPANATVPSTPWYELPIATQYAPLSATGYQFTDTTIRELSFRLERLVSDVLVQFYISDAVTGAAKLAFSGTDSTPITSFDEVSLFTDSNTYFYLHSVKVETDVSAIPEPASLAWASGLLTFGLVATRRRRRNG
ncbi:MAG: hypothetical protein RL376_1143 [Verrucomicrobiota bacterium]|jgi:hypothetical protein